MPTQDSQFHLNSLLRPPKVTESTGYPHSTLYLKVNEGLMTPPIKLGQHSSAWPAREIAAINKARIAGKSDDEIRVLVKQLIADRQK